MKVKQYRKILLLVLMICAAILFGCVERALGRQLSTQQIASEWSAEDSYAQISCFFSKDAAVTKDYVIQLEQKFKDQAGTEIKNCIAGGVRGYIGCKRKNAGGLLQHKRGTYPLF